MSTLVRRKSARRFHLSGWPFLVVGIAAIVACTSLPKSDESGAPRFPGQMIDVGGHSLYVDCQGPPSARPVVVLEAGMGSVAERWAVVRGLLDPEIRVCAYDRAGLGRSTPVPARTSPTGTVSDLRVLLDRLSPGLPAILVGHSYGGLVARIFAAERPDRVAGLVMVDSAHEDMTRSLPEPARDGLLENLRAFAGNRALVSTGEFQAAGEPASLAEGLPEPARTRAEYLFGLESHWVASDMEAQAYPAAEAAGRKATSFGDTPLIVLYVDGYPDFMRDAWRMLQADLASRSSVSEFELVAGASHRAIQSDPRFAPRVVLAIERLVQRVHNASQD